MRDHLPDLRLVQYLEVMRAHGRDDCPVRAMWNALLAGSVFHHASPASLLRERARNAGPMDACGFDPLPIQRKPKPWGVTASETGVLRIELAPTPAPVRAVPSNWNVSRFLANVIELEETLGMITRRASPTGARRYCTREPPALTADAETAAATPQARARECGVPRRPASVHPWDRVGNNS